MSAQRLLTLALVAMAVLAPGAMAQEKNEVAGLIGRTFISDVTPPGTSFFDNTIHSGNGLTFEALYGRHLWGRDSFLSVTFEVPFVINPDEDLNYGQNVIPESYLSYFVTPAVRLNVFANTGISPWISFGGGFGHFSESSNLVFGGPNPGARGTTTGVYQLGAGLDVRVHGPWTVRLDVRDFNSGTPQLNVNLGKDRQHNIFVGGGIAYRF